MAKQELSFVTTVPFTENGDDFHYTTQAALTEAGVVIVRHFFDPRSIGQNALAELFGHETTPPPKGFVITDNPNDDIFLPGKMQKGKPVSAGVSDNASSLLKCCARLVHDQNPEFIRSPRQLAVSFQEVARSGAGPWMPPSGYPKVVAYLPGISHMTVFQPNGILRLPENTRNLAPFFKDAIINNRGTPVIVECGSLVLANNHGAAKISDNGLYFL